MEHAFHWLFGGGVGSSAGALGTLGTFGVIAGVGVATIASASINMLKYNNLRSDICDTYRDEIAGKLNKDPMQVTVKDMDTLAKGAPDRGIEANQTLAEELQKLKGDRNLGIGITLISILAALPLAMWVGGGLAFSAGGITLANAGVLLGKLAIGFACHKAIEYPVEAAGQAIFHMEGQSTHERIEELINVRAVGKELSKEQVLGVFLSANQELQEFVKQQFGGEYDKLALPVKQRIVETFEQFVPIGQVTESLNTGRVRITELAFSANGQSSGILPSEKPTPPKLNVVGKARGLLQHVNVAMNRWQQNRPPKQQEYQVYSPPIITKPSEPLRPQRKEVFYDNPERSDGNKWANVVRGQAVSKAPEQKQPQPIDYNPAYAGR
jgi:hypothetical protein